MFLLEDVIRTFKKGGILVHGRIEQNWFGGKKASLAIMGQHRICGGNTLFPKRLTLYQGGS